MAGKLPSHLTTTQAARFVGVTQGAATQWMSSGEVAVLVVFGVKMVAIEDCRAWKRRRSARTSPSPKLINGARI